MCDKIKMLYTLSLSLPPPVDIQNYSSLRTILKYCILRILPLPSAINLGALETESLTSASAEVVVTYITETQTQRQKANISNNKAVSQCLSHQFLN